jgi:AP-5 complex subunit mu-1
MSGGGCSVRAIWILTPHDAVAFSRRFAVVEKRWRVAWEAEGGARAEMMPLPADYEVAAAFAERRRRFCLLFFLSLTPLDCALVN